MGENLEYQQLSKSERRRLWRQENAKSRNLSHLLKIVLVVLFVLGVVGFIGWWGIRFQSRSKSIAAASNIGGIATDFKLPATIGGTIALSDYKGKKNVLIYFHEGMSCDPCMQQMPELEKVLPDFDNMDVALLYVAFDPIDDLKKAADKYNLKTPILSYNSAKTEVDYDLTRFSMGMGRRAGHTFVLVDKEGKIIWRKDYWPGYGMSVDNGKMFVDAKEIVDNVKIVLDK